MVRVLILGYGNPLRSDDGVGWQAAVELFRSLRAPDVEVLPCHQLTPDLAEPMSHAETVLFLDVTREGRAGEVRCEPIQAREDNPSFSHHVTPDSLLAMARDLYGAFPQAWMLTICGRCFDPGEALSAEVEAALPRLKARVRELIAEGTGALAAAH